MKGIIGRNIESPFDFSLRVQLEVDPVEKSR